ncbi:MarR family winged helix-turn-helix transcriptional regulator [Methylotenera sp. G11]|uniref:MarR family winged helix-turn-helix transcriptional regulator n=1 Tax=Methylotenera sp. G11 TaxID=1506585 RepID=UPI00064622EB|nr:MarR family transcriptional regulator [Methylotenera sp. G11]
MNKIQGSASPRNSALDVLKLFRIIFKSANRHFHEIEKVAGVGGASLWALAEVAETDKLTVTELANRMSIHQSTASNLLDKLGSEGYIEKVKSTSDRRVVHVMLTEQGRATLEKAPLPHRGMLPDALMRLSPTTLAELNQHLLALVAGMEGTQAGAAFEPLGKA